MKTETAVMEAAVIRDAVMEEELKKENERAKTRRIPDEVVDEVLAFMRESENAIHE